jgi:peptide/nickel transport system substrate-binding protein
LFAVFGAACDAVSPREAILRNQLLIGVPEGLVAGTDLGLQDLARSLSIEGLMQLGPDGRALPRLAESWSWEDDGRRLRVLLRSGVTFHDGTPLTPALAAELVNEAVQRPGNRMLFTALSDITAVRPDGNRAIVFDLAQRSAFLPEDLELPLSHGPERAGTGAYKVVKREPTEIVLERFEHYYGGLAQIHQIVIKPFGPLRTAWASLLRGEVDMVTDVPPDAVQFIKNDEVDVISYARRYQYLVAFNSRQPPFNTRAVRRALNYAVDRQTLIKQVLQGQGEPSAGPLWPKHWAYDTSVAPYAYDPELAMSLLDAAGLPADTRQGRPNTRFSFTCLIPANFSLVERLGLDVQKQLYNIGVDMQFEVVPAEEFDARVRDGRFEAILFDLVSGPSFGRSYLFWASTREVKGLNVFGYENAEAERLFGVLRRSTNEAAVRSATSNLQRVLLDDPPALFLAWQQKSRAIRRDFQVVREPDRDPLSTIWRWSAPSHSTTQTQ